MSYAPGSLQPPSAPASPAASWILCRGLNVIPIGDHAALVSCAERGRVKPDDYLINPGLDICIQAKDISELDLVFRKKTFLRLGNISSLLAWAWQKLRGSSGL